MSWNEYLYWYAQDRGGVFFGTEKGGKEGLLFLEDPEERIHLVEAQVSMEQEVSMRDEVFGLFEEMDQEARRKEYEDCGFPRQLDALVELARAARDAVTAWPMPIKTW